MQVYRDAPRTVDPREVIAGIAEMVGGDALAPRPHDAWTWALIEAGELESAVADAESPARDDPGRLTNAARALTEAVARGHGCSWGCGAAADVGGTAAALRRLRGESLPPRLALPVSEGYAYYGLYPETYRAAAQRFHDRVRPPRVVVIGIRSIGTSLSAVVAAALAARGVDVRTVTVRPRGHPWEREAALGDRLARAIARRAGAWFAVVDEGPGLSGSSFAAVSDALERLGVPVERIVLFPSWRPDGSAFVSERARRRWARHEKYVGDFDAIWLRSGRLTDGATVVDDLSAGAWRARAYENGAEWPAAHPQHERRKLLTRAEECEEPRRFEFVGLGRYGAPRLDRARRLHDAGFAPRPHALRHGFLESDTVQGRPLRCDGVDAAMLRRVAAYLAHLHIHERATDGADARTVAAAAWENAAAALGLPADAAESRAVRALASHAPDAPFVRVDGRMLPHEWIVGDRAWKTDALSHHDDHFLPGCTDIAWDLAGAAVEMELSPESEALLVAEYVARSGDATVERRLPLHRVAYPAFRAAYARLAAPALGESDDGGRMARAGRGYTERVRAAVGAWVGAGTDAGADA